jgi:hypothetical protein
MNWLPYDSWTVESPLDPPALVAGLQSRIEPVKWFRKWNANHAPLQGTIGDWGFSASRVIEYRNSFLPMLYGKFIPTASGTTILIRMMPHPGVLAFMACWFGMLGLFGVVSVLTGGWKALILIVPMAGFGFLLLYGGFFAEAGTAQKLITQALLEVHKEAENQGGAANDATTTTPMSPRQ